MMLPVFFLMFGMLDLRAEDIDKTAAAVVTTATVSESALRGRA